MESINKYDIYIRNVAVANGGDSGCDGSLHAMLENFSISVHVL